MYTDGKNHIIRIHLRFHSRPLRVFAFKFVSRFRSFAFSRSLSDPPLRCRSHERCVENQDLSQSRGYGGGVRGGAVVAEAGGGDARGEEEIRRPAAGEFGRG